MTDEHDELLDERRLLASAYLDDELSPTERARAEGDPAVQAEVEALRSVRAALAVVPEPDSERREAAIAAAIAAAGATVEAPSPPPVAARRRARWYAPLAAAAVAVLVVGGIIALRSGRGDDDSADDAARDVPVAEQTDAEDGTERDSGGAAATTASAAAEPEAAVPTTVATAAEGTEAAAEFAESTIAAATAGTSNEALVAPIIVADADDLRDVVTFLAAADAAAGSDAPGDTATRSEPQCDLGRFVIAARYEPDDSTARDVEIFVLDDGGELVAADATTCEVLLTTTP